MIPSLKDALGAGGAPVMWERVVLEGLPKIRQLVPSGSQVLEIGYGDGQLTCFLCQNLGWRIVGLDCNPSAYKSAMTNAGQCRLSDQIDFFLCDPQETRQHQGTYDAVFIKTVLYSLPDHGEYSRWLDWILSILKPGGIFIDFETGRANEGVQLYRRIRRREYTDSCLYTAKEEALYDKRFEIIDRRYYGGWSQFLAPIPILYKAAYRIEEAISRRNADNCFVVSIIARKK
jgi:ubiquinone/menaquinone biosynthesis C-methylase UbiE